jgi:hypothetical protein
MVLTQGIASLIQTSGCYNKHVAETFKLILVVKKQNKMAYDKFNILTVQQFRFLLKM